MKHYNIILFITIFFLNCVFLYSQGSAEPTIDRNVALVQYYRWLQLYERPMNEQRIQDQLEILTDDVELQSSTGTMKGKKEYPQRVAIYKGWKNAHHVETVRVNTNNDGTLSLQAVIRYMNIQPSGEKASYKMKYDTTLEKSRDLLPRFSSIVITPQKALNESYKDTYPENRVRSLMHYWLALFEQLKDNSKDFEEILDPNFVLNFSSVPFPVDSLEKF